MLSCALRLLALLLIFAAAPVAAAQSAPPGPASALTPAQSQQILAILQNDQRRAEFIGVLQNMAKALPAAEAVAQTVPATTPPQPAAPAIPAPAAAAPHPAAPAAAPAALPALPLARDGLAWQILTEASLALEATGQQLATSLRAVNDLPALTRWLRVQAADPAAQNRILNTAWRLALIVLAALAAEWVATRVLRRLRLALARWAPAMTHAGEDRLKSGAGDARHRRFGRALRLLRRLPFALGRLLLDLLPVAVFGVVGNLLTGTELGALATTRFATGTVLNSYVFCRIVLCVTRMLVAPRQPRLRLVQMSDAGAWFLLRLVRRVVVVAVAGEAIGEIGLTLGMYPSAEESWIKLVGLVVHVTLILAVIHVRAPVCRRLRAPPGAVGTFAALRNRFAKIWHLVAIFWIVASWLVLAVEVHGGIAWLAQFFLVTSAILVAARLIAIALLGGVDRVFHLGPETSARYPGLEARANFYYPIVRRLISGVVGGLTLFVLLEAWGWSPIGWLARSGLGGRVLWAGLLIVLVCIIAVVVWEGANAALERQLSRFSEGEQAARAARLRTLLPMLRTALSVAILSIVALTVLSQIGVNIAPLLAGAGVIGIAVGFGSQKLVQDFITGIFLLFENAMQVGDWVTVAGLSGTVEMLSIRTIRMRAGDGSMHIIPFSSVTTVNNTNRDFANADVVVGVAYKEDTDRVSEILGEIVAEMRAEPDFADKILADFSLWGVDQLGDFAVTIKGQVRTTAGGRWPVQREINRRIKKRFAEAGIEIPFPVRTILLQQDAGAPPTAEIPADTAPPPQTDPASPPPAAMETVR